MEATGAAWRRTEWWQPPVTAAGPVDIVAIDEDHFRSFVDTDSMWTAGASEAPA